MIHGLNGTGKTNVLDAIYCLATAKSYFGVPDLKLITHGSNFYRIEGRLNRDSQEVRLVNKYERGKKKLVEKNGKAYDRLSDHIGTMPVVMITPDDLILVNGLSQDRRRFVDQALAQTDHTYLNHLVDYKRLLKQRNVVLKTSVNPDHMLLDSYDARMAPSALYITSKRKAFIDNFRPQLEVFYHWIAQVDEQIDVKYLPSLDGKDYIEASQESRKRDIFLKRTETGPHKDKIEFYLGPRAFRMFGSQGQKKNLVLAMKLAQHHVLSTQLHLPPLILLDDLFDRLDHQRVKRLIDLILKSNFGQILITDTRLSRIENILGSQPINAIELTKSKSNEEE